MGAHDSSSESLFESKVMYAHKSAKILPNVSLAILAAVAKHINQNVAENLVIAKAGAEGGQFARRIDQRFALR